MFRIVEKRRLYFILSGLIILIGLIAMIYSTATTGSPFKLAIDFTGGSIWQLQFDQQIAPEDFARCVRRKRD